jgi:hypothetical protein
MGEPAGKHDCVGAGEVIVTMPDQFGFSSEQPHRMDDIVFAIRSGEDDDGDGHGSTVIS